MQPHSHIAFLESPGLCVSFEWYLYHHVECYLHLLGWIHEKCLEISVQEFESHVVVPKPLSVTPEFIWCEVRIIIVIHVLVEPNLCVSLEIKLQIVTTVFLQVSIKLSLN